MNNSNKIWVKNRHQLVEEEKRESVCFMIEKEIQTSQAAAGGPINIWRPPVLIRGPPGLWGPPPADVFWTRSLTKFFERSDILICISLIKNT